MTGDTDAQQAGIAPMPGLATELPQAATAGSPWQTVPKSPAGSFTEQRGRPALPGAPVPSGQPPAARRRSGHPADIRTADATTELRTTNTKHLRPSPPATAGVGRGTPAATNPTRPARVAGRKEES